MADRPLHRHLGVVMVLLLSAPLLFAGSGEVQQQAMRVIFGLNGRTIAQPAIDDGYVSRFIPSLAVSPAYADELVARQSSSAMAFWQSVAVVRRGQHAKVGLEELPQPPATIWENPHMAAWFALRATDWSAPGAKTRPTWVGALLEEAQRREPTNGVYWYAQALLAEKQGNASTVLHALEAAVARPKWDDHRSEVDTELRKIASTTLGIPESELLGGDVGTALWILHSGWGPTPRRTSEIGSLLGEAHKSGPKIWNEALAALAGLDAVRWADPTYHSVVAEVLGPHSTFHDVITQAPCKERNPFEDPPEDSRWTEHLRALLADGLPDASVQHLAGEMDETHRASDLRRHGASSGFDRWEEVREAGSLHLLCLGISLALLALAVPFGKSFEVGRSVALRTGSFWIKLVGAAVIAEFVLFRAASAALAVPWEIAATMSSISIVGAICLQIGLGRWRARPFSFGVLWSLGTLVLAVVEGGMRAAPFG